MRKSKNVKTLKIKTIAVLAVSLVAFLSIFYIYQTNKEVSERYLVKDYTKRISQFSEENKDLEIRSTESGSLDKIAQLIESTDYEKTEKIHYIKVLNGYVVAK